MVQSFRNKNILSHIVREFETLNCIHVLKKNMVFGNRNQSKK